MDFLSKVALRCSPTTPSEINTQSDLLSAIESPFVIREKNRKSKFVFTPGPSRATDTANNIPLIEGSNSGWKEMGEVMPRAPDSTGGPPA